MNWTNEDLKMVEKFIEIKNRGLYCDGVQLTQVYNRVLGKNANVTSCGSCLRGRVQELEVALNRFKQLSEASKEAEVNNVKESENKALVEAGNDDMKARMAKVRSHRKINKQ